MATTLNRLILKSSDENLSTIKTDITIGGTQELALGELLISTKAGEEAICFLTDTGEVATLRSLELNLSSPVSAQYLRYDGTNWVNSSILASDIPDLSLTYATAAQGDLADTALQSGDNISTLNNDADYIVSDTSVAFGADVVTNIISLTEAEYLAITPNASTLYVIV